MKTIARIENGFVSKFGVPRQAGIVAGVKSLVVFEPEYRNADAVRGMEAFSHIWLIWMFSEAERGTWSPTVRPPRLGGNERVGVFATRSPFRPNPIGLSCVKLDKVEFTRDRGAVLHVSGADLMNGTPIFDIKPYLPFADSVPSATGGLPKAAVGPKLRVEFDEELRGRLAGEDPGVVAELLAEDPRPAYQDDPTRIYAMAYGRYEVKFTVADGVLTVVDVVPAR